MLPKGFPENFELKLANGKSTKFSFICTMCNELIYDKYANTQYQTKIEGSWEYEKTKEMSIFFEIDGPYKCMMIPTSKKEGENLKKKYAVFNFDGKICELKGFELKRRGELELIKVF